MYQIKIIKANGTKLLKNAIDGKPMTFETIEKATNFMNSHARTYKLAMYEKRLPAAKLEVVEVK